MLYRDLLDEKVIARRGRFRRTRRWWRGIHPDKGVITKGWTGWETVEEKDQIVPVRTFWVKERPPTCAIKKPQCPGSYWPTKLFSGKGPRQDQ
jgi:hypothetical protein